MGAPEGSYYVDELRLRPATTLRQSRHEFNVSVDLRRSRGCRHDAIHPWDVAGDANGIDDLTVKAFHEGEARLPPNGLPEGRERHCVRGGAMTFTVSRANGPSAATAVTWCGPGVPKAICTGASPTVSACQRPSNNHATLRVVPTALNVACNGRVALEGCRSVV